MNTNRTPDTIIFDLEDIDYDNSRDIDFDIKLAQLQYLKEKIKSERLHQLEMSKNLISDGNECMIEVITKIMTSN